MSQVLSTVFATASSRPAQGNTPPATVFAIELLAPTHYARLGIADDADAVVIEEAWMRLQRSPRSAPLPLDTEPLRAVAWPQSGVLESAVVRARQRAIAYAVLSDPARRAIYDAWLADHREQITRPPESPAWQRWLHSRRGHWQIGALCTVLAALLLAWLGT